MNVDKDNSQQQIGIIGAGKVRPKFRPTLATTVVLMLLLLVVTLQKRKKLLDQKQAN